MIQFAVIFLRFLNMLKGTSTADYQMSGIYMTAVDTGINLVSVIVLVNLCMYA
jgi:hypothetical protein